jgi:pyruvate-formate lyase-activating enzyme
MNVIHRICATPASPGELLQNRRVHRFSFCSLIWSATRSASIALLAVTPNCRDDLERRALRPSRSLGRIVPNLSGGEPFLRPEFGEICRQFIRRNQVRQIYVPTNGYFTERTVKQITETLKEKDLDLFVAELSLDGLGEFHNKFRGSPGSFDKSMETYDALAKLQESDSRLRIHSISTASDVNMDEIRRLTTYLFDRCPKMINATCADPRDQSPLCRVPARWNTSWPTRRPRLWAT